MYGDEHWTIKKAEHWRINTFELWCWRRLLKVPWTASWSNRSTLKEINLQYSLEGLMLELHYFGYLMRRTDSWKRPWCWKRSKAGGEGFDRGWNGWMASPTQWTWVWADSGRRWRTGKPGMLQSTGSQSQTLLSNWTITTSILAGEMLWTEEPGELQFLGSQRVGHCLATKQHIVHDF